MKKIIAFVLSLLMINLSLVSCFKRDTEKPKEYLWGQRSQGWPHAKTINGLLKSDTNEFDINDVTFDFYYCLYCLDDQTLEEAKDFYYFDDRHDTCYETCFAIYISKYNITNYYSNIFEMGDDGRILDFENVDGQLFKFITYEEAFETDYGCTTYGVAMINYNHCEKLTIPAEFFVLEGNIINIDIFRITHDLNKDAYYLAGGMTSTNISLYYKFSDGKVIISD